MRTEKAIKNVISSMASYFVLTILGFIVQSVLKHSLGAEYLGISGLFTNIISGLSVIELGFGSAIIVNMYKPVAENDTDMIVSLLQFYKKIYVIISAIVLVVGLAIVPFVDVIIGETTVPIPTKAFFLLYLFDVIASYLLTYKRSVLYANQKTYYITWIHMFAVVVTNIVQIIFLLTLKNYFLYLITSIVLRVIENIVINILIDKAYPYVKHKEIIPLKQEVKDDIKKKVSGLFFHKISTFLVYGTDNIIISMVPGLGIIMVGIYSSYSMITTKLTALIDSIFNSVTAGVGNLLIEDDKEKSYRMFKNIQFMNGWIYIFFSIAFYYISFPFVEVWMGKDFVLDAPTVLVIAVGLFIAGMRASFGIFKNAAGIFYEDRFIPIIEAGVNLVTSIPLALMLGLKGVLIGTMCSNLLLYIYSYRKYVYGTIFGKNTVTYCKDLLKYVLYYIIAFISTAAVQQFINFESIWMQLVMVLVVSAIVPNAVIVLLNYRTEEFRYVWGIVCKVIPLDRFKR